MDVSEEWVWTLLLERSLDGDTHAYQQLLSSLTVAMRQAVRVRARSAGIDAEDVVQEVLLALHLKRSTWERGTPVAPWVAAIARNKLVDAWRRRGRRIEISMDDVLETLQQDDSPSVDHAHDLGRLLPQLNERQRAVLESISLQGCSARETATRLNMSEGAVRVTLHRGLKALAVLFREVPNANR